MPIKRFTYVVVCLLLFLTAPLPLFGQTVARTTLYVEETQGIRRFFYPVDARVPFASGELSNSENVRLLSDGTEIPATYTALESWPDGSVQWLGVNFNMSIGPLGAASFEVEYGPSVRSVVTSPRGLTVADDVDSVQVGRIRLSKGGDPLLQSVDFGGETIGSGRNGLRVHDHDGEMFPIDVSSVVFDFVRQGDQFVEVHYTGLIPLSSGVELPFEMSVGMPNSKSWLRVSIFVDDQNDHIRGLSFDTPVLVGALPLVWDFGTDRWTYGSLRSITDEVQLFAPSRTDPTRPWEVETQRDDRREVYEVSTGDSRLSMWGHVQSERVVAFGMDPQSEGDTTHYFAIDGRGQLSMGEESVDARQHRIVIYHHYVSLPVQIGAATSPTSMLYPLVTRCDSERYVESGVEVPSF